MSRNKAISISLVLVIVVVGTLIRYVVPGGDDEDQNQMNVDVSTEDQNQMNVDVSTEDQNQMNVDVSTEDQNQVNVDASTEFAVTVIATDQKDQQQASNPPPAGAKSPAGSRTEPSVGAQATQPTANQPTSTPQPTSTGHLAADRIRDGERICGPGCPEQYVVRVARDARFKRLLLSYDIITFYGHFSGRMPEEVEHTVLDAFETSCFVWHEQAGRRTYYFFDARPGTDAGVRWRIDATNAEIRAAGIDIAAFQVNERELAYFKSAGQVALPQALSLWCAG